MWERWFRSWLNALFWWLPRSEERPEDTPPQRRHETVPDTPPPAAETDDIAPTTRPEPAAAPSDGGAADLTDISGIGPAMRRSLEAAGIETVAQLAAADADALAAQLKSSQRRVSRPQVQRWIDTAREHG